MQQHPTKFSTALACRIVQLDRARFNEAVSGGYLRCVPETIAGRTRYFSSADLLAPWYFRNLVEDGYTREKAGQIACEVAATAHQFSDAATITYVEDYFVPRSGRAYPSDQVPDHSKWSAVSFSGTNIRKSMTFNVKYDRELIAHNILVESSKLGEED